LIFWDFDGVIKDSIEVKARAFFDLFKVFGKGVAERAREHHQSHGGMSRFDKVPLYLQWAGEEPSQSRVAEFCDRFGLLVLQGVIDAPWVAGVEAYLRSNPHRQAFSLVSATPQDELEQILQALSLAECFGEVFGAPTSKQDAICRSLANHRLAPQDCLMIGDARADFDAANINRVPFLLRSHQTNSTIFSDYSGPSIKDFIEL
jgi:phosphoglycolate phosphatase-like HAD superfamily hydrolase